MKRVLFAGTPDFALPSLQALYDAGYNIVGVLTQPDRLGSKNKLTPPPAKLLAERLGLAVYQYDKVRSQGVQTIRDLAPDVMVTAAYGQIISQEIIDIPTCGVVNVHASLLPHWRGASPIQQSVLAGDSVTGVTIMRTALAVDSGDIILQKSTEIGPTETAGELFDRLAVLGAVALVEALPAVLDGTAVYTPQDHTQATFCKMLKKEDGRIDWHCTVRQLDCHVRGMNPWPSAFCTINGKMCKIWQISILHESTQYVAGTVVAASAKDGIVVQCADGVVRLDVLQPEGGRRMSGKEYMVGHALSVGSVLA